MSPGSGILANFLAQQILGLTIGEIYRAGKRKVLNFFGIQTEGQELEETLENVESELTEYKEDLDWAKDQIEEKDSKISEKERRISRLEQIFRSLERKGISRNELIQKFERPIPVLIVSYTNQNSPENQKFVRDTLSDKLAAKNMGAGTVVVPPREVLDADLTDSDSVEKWFEEEVYEGKVDRKAIIKHATIADLSKDVYWRDDYEYDSRTGSAIGDVIELAEALDEGLILDLIDATDKAALKELIQEGDIGFFASRWLDGSSLDSIHANQSEIESRLDDRLGELDLTHLASASAVPKISDIFSEFLDLSQNELQEVGEGIVDEANIWKREFESW